MSATLTLQEVAHFLKLSEETVSAMVERGEIPTERVGGQLVFRLDVLENWLSTQLKAVQARTASAPLPDAETLALSDVLREEHVVMEVPQAEPAEVVRRLIEPLVGSGTVTNPETLAQAVMARERLMSTGIGQGYALPHPRHPMPFLFDHLAVVVGLSHGGIEFGAIDGEPVHVLFLLGAPNDQWHLWALAVISELIRQGELREKLLDCTSAQEVLEVVRRQERRRRQNNRGTGSRD